MFNLFNLSVDTKKPRCLIIGIDEKFRKRLVEVEKKQQQFYSTRLGVSFTTENKKRIKKNAYDMFDFQLSDISKERFSLYDNQSLKVYLKCKDDDLYIDTHLHYADPLPKDMELGEAIKDTLVKDYDIAYRYSLLGEIFN